MIAMIVDYREVNALDPRRFDRALRRNLMIAMKVFGNKAERRVRRIMRSGKYAKNSPPWAAAKGSGRPLYHTGHMSTRIKNRVIPGVGDLFVSVEVGFLDNAPHPERGNIGMQSLVGWLSKDQSWEPTKSQADAFWAKVPSEWKKTHAPIFKGVFESPARDFMHDALLDPVLQNTFLHYVKYATDRALQGK